MKSIDPNSRNLSQLYLKMFSTCRALGAITEFFPLGTGKNPKVTGGCGVRVGRAAEYLKGAVLQLPRQSYHSEWLWAISGSDGVVLVNLLC